MRCAMLWGTRGLRVLGFVLIMGSWFSLLRCLVVFAEVKPGESLSQENWQEAKGLMPEAVLHRFQDGSYTAKVITLSSTLGWGRKFKSASETNEGKFAIDPDDSLIANATNTY